MNNNITDTDRINWLAKRCYLPGDHPDRGLFVVVDEQASPFGSFNCEPGNDRVALRAAIDRMMAAEKHNFPMHGAKGKAKATTNKGV